MMEAKPSTPRPGLADWVDLLDRTRADQGVRESELHRRDRAIGETLGHLEGRSALRIAAWVRATRDSAASETGRSRSPGLVASEAVRTALALLGLVGLALGASAAFGAFSYQPLGRINVIAVIAVLVGIPSLLLALALLHALPERARRWLPWIGRESAEGGPLQPARWALRALPQEPRTLLEDALGGAGALGTLSAGLRRWLLLAGSQAAALAFQTGALFAVFAQVVFTDLSFGWSTTLEADARSIEEVTRVVAAPWAQLWPEAVPTRALIESTRFYRIAPDPGAELVVYGHWWPFVAMCLLAYGWLPRALFLAAARWQLRRALRVALVEAPGSQRVLQRLSSPLVESRADEPESGEAQQDSGVAALGETPMPERGIVLVWGEAIRLDAAADTLATEVIARHEVGGRKSPAEDAETIVQAAAAARASDVPVILVVRGYEPPLAEQVDILAALREALGSGHPIVVAAVGAAAERLEAWRRRLARQGDPWLALASIETSIEPSLQPSVEEQSPRE